MFVFKKQPVTWERLLSWRRRLRVGLPTFRFKHPGSNPVLSCFNLLDWQWPYPILPFWFGYIRDRSRFSRFGMTICGIDSQFTRFGKTIFGIDPDSPFLVWPYPGSISIDPFGKTIFGIDPDSPGLVWNYSGSMLILQYDHIQDRNRVYRSE